MVAGVSVVLDVWPVAACGSPVFHGQLLWRLVSSRSLSLSLVLGREGGGIIQSPCWQHSDQCLVSTHARDIRPPLLLIGVVVVIVLLSLSPMVSVGAEGRYKWFSINCIMSAKGLMKHSHY